MKKATSATPSKFGLFQPSNRGPLPPTLWICLLLLIASWHRTEAVVYLHALGSGVWNGNCATCWTASAACAPPSSAFSMSCTEPEMIVVYEGNSALTLDASLPTSTPLSNFELRLGSSDITVNLSVLSNTTTITSFSPSEASTFRAININLIQDNTHVHLTNIRSIDASIALALPRLEIQATGGFIPGNVYISDSTIEWQSSPVPGISLPLPHGLVEITSSTLNQTSGAFTQSGISLNAETHLKLNASTASSAASGPFIFARGITMLESSVIRLSDMETVANVNYVLNASSLSTGVFFNITGESHILTEPTGSTTVKQNGRLLWLPDSSSALSTPPGSLAAPSSATSPSTPTGSQRKVALNLIGSSRSTSSYSTLQNIDFSTTSYSTPNTTVPSDLISDTATFSYARIINCALSLRGQTEFFRTYFDASTLYLINATIISTQIDNTLVMDRQSTLVLGGIVSVDDPFTITAPALRLFPYTIASIPSISMDIPDFTDPPITCLYDPANEIASRPFLTGNSSLSLAPSFLLPVAGPNIPPISLSSIWTLPSMDISNCRIDFSQVNVLQIAYNTSLASGRTGRQFLACSSAQKCVEELPTNFLVDWRSTDRTPTSGRFPLFAAAPGPNIDALADKTFFNSVDPSTTQVSPIAVQFDKSNSVVSFFFFSCPPLLPVGFTCYPNGSIIANGDIDTPTITIPSSVGVIIINGNFTASTVIFQDSNTTLYIRGCANISSITLELDSTTPSGRRVLIKQSGQNCTSLANIPFTTTGGQSSCKKVTAKTESSDGSTLSVLFQINDSGCNTKWIILGAVLGGVVLITVIALILIFTLVPKARSCIRPYSKRNGSGAKNVQ